MPRVRRDVQAWLAIALFFLAAPGTGADEARVVPLKHRTAAEIIPLIRPLLGPDDALTGTDYRLIIRASEKTLREVERVLAQLDVAQQQLRITVDQSSIDNRADTSQSVSGEVRVGDNARVVLPRRPAEKDGVVVLKDGLRYSGRQRTSSASHASIQTVTTLDGKPAHIHIGQSVPHVQRILALSGGQLILAQGIELQDVVTGFDVLPRVRGDRVMVEITPRLSTLQNPATGLVNFQGLATTVEVKRGEWLDLGKILGQRSQIQKAILESASTDSDERRTVRIKIE